MDFKSSFRFAILEIDGDCQVCNKSPLPSMTDRKRESELSKERKILGGFQMESARRKERRKEPRWRNRAREDIDIERTDD